MATLSEAETGAWCSFRVRSSGFNSWKNRFNFRKTILQLWQFGGASPVRVLGCGYPVISNRDGTQEGCSVAPRHKTVQGIPNGLLLGGARSPTGVSVHSWVPGSIRKRLAATIGVLPAGEDKTLMDVLHGFMECGTRQNPGREGVGIYPLDLAVPQRIAGVGALDLQLNLHAFGSQLHNPRRNGQSHPITVDHCGIRVG